MDSPPRTLLYGLPLKGVGSEQVESLRSYVQRLAVTHQMRAADMVSMMWGNLPNGRMQAHLFHGMGENARTLLQAAERATGQSLKASSMGRFKRVLGSQHLIRPMMETLYCPLCVRDQSGELPYGRLTWELSPVSACAVHGVRLRSSQDCGAPQSEQLPINQRSMHPGVCNKCGSIGFRCRDSQDTATPEEIWVAREVGGVVALPDAVVDSLTAECVRAGIIATLIHSFGGHGVPAALAAGLSSGCVVEWLRGVRGPTLGALLKFAYAANAGVAGILQGEYREAPGGGYGVGRLSIASRKYGMKDWALVRTALATALVDESAPALSTLAARLGVSARQIRKKLPAEARVLVRRSEQRRRREHQRIEETAVEAYRAAAKALKAEGVPVTKATLQKRSGLHVYPNQAGRRRAFIKVLSEFNPAAVSIAAPAGSQDGADSSAGAGVARAASPTDDLPR